MAEANRSLGKARGHVDRLRDLAHRLLEAKSPAIRDEIGHARAKPEDVVCQFVIGEDAHVRPAGLSSRGYSSGPSSLTYGRFGESGCDRLTA